MPGCWYLWPFLMLCGCTQIKYVPLPPLTIPADLLADCIPPAQPQPFNYRASVEWNEQLLNTLSDCNLDKAGLRRIDAVRQEYPKKAGGDNK